MSGSTARLYGITVHHTHTRVPNMRTVRGHTRANGRSSRRVLPGGARVRICWKCSGVGHSSRGRTSPRRTQFNQLLQQVDEGGETTGSSGASGASASVRFRFIADRGKGKGKGKRGGGRGRGRGGFNTFFLS
eukprot:2027176-Prymnesium_polylepis.2